MKQHLARALVIAALFTDSCGWAVGFPPACAANLANLVRFGTKQKQVRSQTPEPQPSEWEGITKRDEFRPSSTSGISSSRLAASRAQTPSDVSSVHSLESVESNAPGVSALSWDLIPPWGRVESAEVRASSIEALDKGDPVTLRMKISGNTYERKATFLSVMHSARDVKNDPAGRGHVPKGEELDPNYYTQFLFMTSDGVEHYVPWPLLNLEVKGGAGHNYRDELIKTSEHQFLQSGAQAYTRNCLLYSLHGAEAQFKLLKQGDFSKIAVSARDLAHETPEIKNIYNRLAPAFDTIDVPGGLQFLHALFKAENEPLPVNLPVCGKQQEAVKSLHPGRTRLTSRSWDLLQALRLKKQAILYTPAYVEQQFPGSYQIITHESIRDEVNQIDYRYVPGQGHFAVKREGMGFRPPKVWNAPGQLWSPYGHAVRAAGLIDPDPRSPQGRFIIAHEALRKRFKYDPQKQTFKPLVIIADSDTFDDRPGSARWQATVTPAQRQDEVDLAQYKHNYFDPKTKVFHRPLITSQIAGLNVYPPPPRLRPIDEFENPPFVLPLDPTKMSDADPRKEEAVIDGYLRVQTGILFHILDEP